MTIRAFLTNHSIANVNEKDGDNSKPEEAAEKRAVVSKDYRRDIKGKMQALLFRIISGDLDFQS